MIYKFVQYDVPPQPQCTMFTLYEKARAHKPLTREEKDRIAIGLYGIMGSQSSSYKLGGYCAPFSRVLPRFLVKIKYYNWKEYYAPDKTSLRKAIPQQVIEIIEAPIHHKKEAVQ